MGRNVAPAKNAYWGAVIKPCGVRLQSFCQIIEPFSRRIPRRVLLPVGVNIYCHTLLLVYQQKKSSDDTFEYRHYNQIIGFQRFLMRGGISAQHPAEQSRLQAIVLDSSMGAYVTGLCRVRD